MTTIETNLTTALQKITTHIASMPESRLDARVYSHTEDANSGGYSNGQYQVRKDIEEMLQDLEICICPLKTCKGFACVREVVDDSPKSNGTDTMPCRGRYHNTDSSFKAMLCMNCEGR